MHCEENKPPKQNKKRSNRSVIHDPDFQQHIALGFFVVVMALLIVCTVIFMSNPNYSVDVVLCYVVVGVVTYANPVVDNALQPQVVLDFCLARW